jgi:hypothetical protein
LIEGIPVDRARVRFTAAYSVTERLTLGVEANPKDDDYGVIANYRVWDETDLRPALILGTSSDRIGTPSGRTYYAMLAKDLSEIVGLPIAPYIGTGFGEFEDEWELLGGVRIAWLERLSTTHMWDSENLHHVIDYEWNDGFRTGIVVAQQDSSYYVGVSLGYSF